MRKCESLQKPDPCWLIPRKFTLNLERLALLYTISDIYMFDFTPSNHLLQFWLPVMKDKCLKCLLSGFVDHTFKLEISFVFLWVLFCNLFSRLVKNGGVGDVLTESLQYTNKVIYFHEFYHWVVNLFDLGVFFIYHTTVPELPDGIRLQNKSSDYADKVVGQIEIRNIRTLPFCDKNSLHLQQT